MLKRKRTRTKTRHVCDDHQNACKIPIHSPLELENFDVGGVSSTQGYIRNSYIILIGISENCNTS